MQPSLLFLATDMSMDDWMNGDYVKSYTALANDLDPNINIMTLDQVSDYSRCILHSILIPLSLIFCGTLLLHAHFFR